MFVFGRIFWQTNTAQAASMLWDVQIGNRKRMAQVWPPGLSHSAEA